MMQRSNKFQDTSALRRRVTNYVCFVPLFFSAIFGWLILRARSAFAEWPRLSGNDPWALVNRSPQDIFHPIFSYSAHINVVYILLPIVFAGCIGIPIVIFATKRGKAPLAWLQIGGCLAAATLLFGQGGRFIFWFLD